MGNSARTHFLASALHLTVKPALVTDAIFDSSARGDIVLDGFLGRGTSARDQIDWNPEWSRRARGEAMIDHCCARCSALVTGIGSLPGAQVLRPAMLNQGLIRFRRDGQTPEQDDAFTDETMQGINATGEAFFSGTTWRGKRAMRVSVVNWRTSSRDVERAIEATRTVLARP